MANALTNSAPSAGKIVYPPLLERVIDTVKTKIVDQPGFAMRLAMVMALLSVWFEQHDDLPRALVEGDINQMAVVAGLQAILLPLVIFPQFSRWALLAFMMLLIPDVMEGWYRYANHSWLGIWCIPFAALFAQWWDSPDFQRYLRATLGIVMLGAAAQKLLAGTYLDGSYISYLSYHGSETEHMFRFLCSASAEQMSCGWHGFLGGFIVGWQILVGVLLLCGFRSLIFLAIEVAFLIGAGIYADEMNFQTLNISLLCIAFGVGMRRDLFYLCIALLLIDAHGISEFVHEFF